MRNVIVLGASGAMGMPLVRILAENPEIEVYASSRKQRSSDTVHWLCGNAKNKAWIQEQLSSQKYHAVVDFLNYSTAEFQDRYRFFLDHTDHYMFLSSARVYAEASGMIREDYPRILDVCRDKDYLSGDSYDLAKARQEDLLCGSGNTNYTIIRPSLTYNDERLQFTLFEKDEWLYRPLDGNSIVFPQDMEHVVTTMSHGEDVAQVISRLIGNPAAFGQIFNVSGGGSMTWGEILDIYRVSLERNLERRVKVSSVSDAARIARDLNRYDQYRFARGISRRFSNVHVTEVVGPVSFRSIDEGLLKCIDGFFAAGAQIRYPDARKAAYLDRLGGGFSKLSHFRGKKQMLRYLLYRTGVRQ